MYGTDKLLINAWLNGQYQGLIGMIYEVLDRERTRSIDTALEELEQERYNQLIKPGTEKLIKALDGELELADLCIYGWVSFGEELKHDASELNSDQGCQTSQSRGYGKRPSWGIMEEYELQQEDWRDKLIKVSLVISVEHVTRSRTKAQREELPHLAAGVEREERLTKSQRNHTIGLISFI